MLDAPAMEGEWMNAFGIKNGCKTNLEKPKIRSQRDWRNHNRDQDESMENTWVSKAGPRVRERTGTEELDTCDRELEHEGTQK